MEEAARLIYREWFVRLRFPGHEHTKVEGGVPEGWQRRALGDAVAIRKGRNITRDTAVEGSVPVVAGGLEPAYYHNQCNCTGPVVTVSASGANAGHVALYYDDIWASDCSYISADATEHVFFFHGLLRHLQREVSGLQKGAAQPHVYPRDLMGLVVVMPSPATLSDFAGHVNPIHELMGNLERQNRRLREARDLLLPRLMSGEVEV
jgi:type I restriction enzyme S subunit